jgi:hypothetical protein
MTGKSLNTLTSMTDKDNCIKCLTIIETVFHLLNNLKQITLRRNANPILRDIAVAQAIRDICNIISGMERDSNLVLLSSVIEFYLNDRDIFDNNQ